MHDPSSRLALAISILLAIVLVSGCNEAQRLRTTFSFHGGGEGALDRWELDIEAGDYTVLRADAMGIHKHLASSMPGWIPLEGSTKSPAGKSPYYLRSYITESNLVVVFKYLACYQIHVVNTKGESNEVFNSSSDMTTATYGSGWPLLCADDKSLYLLMWPITLMHEEPGRPLAALYSLSLDSLADSEPVIEVVWKDAGKWLTRNDKPDRKPTGFSACKLAVHHGSFYLLSCRSDDRENPNQGYTQFDLRLFRLGPDKQGIFAPAVIAEWLDLKTEIAFNYFATTTWINPQVSAGIVCIPGSYILQFDVSGTSVKKLEPIDTEYSPYHFVDGEGNVRVADFKRLIVE